MEYQNGISKNLLGNTLNHPSKFRTKNWVEINDDSCGTCNNNSRIKCKISRLMLSLCDYSDAYTLVKRTITNAGRGADAAARQPDEINIGVIFKNCALFINSISELNNTQTDNAKDLGIVMLMYNLIEYSDNYSKTSGSLCQNYRDEPNATLADSESFKSKINITGSTPADGNTNNVEIAVSLK